MAIKQELLTDASSFVFYTLGQDSHRTFDNLTANSDLVTLHSARITAMLTDALSDEHRGKGTVAQRSAAEKVLLQLPRVEKKL